MKLRCAAHGEVEWEGDVICSNCKTTYLCEGVFEDEFGKKKRRYPDAPPKGMCSCGQRLFGGTDFTALPICHGCATKSPDAN